MRAAETIAAAIEKLEAQREATSMSDRVWVIWDACISVATANLLVTLLRTIDAQLAILYWALPAAQALPGAFGDLETGRPYIANAETRALDLAHAILGSDS